MHLGTQQACGGPVSAWLRIIMPCCGSHLYICIGHCQLYAVAAKAYAHSRSCLQELPAGVACFLACQKSQGSRPAPCLRFYSERLMPPRTQPGAACILVWLSLKTHKRAYGPVRPAWDLSQRCCCLHGPALQLEGSCPIAGCLRRLASTWRSPFESATPPRHTTPCPTACIACASADGFRGIASAAS